MVLITFHYIITLQGMARKLRVEYPGAIYHVMSRGDRCEKIFKADSDLRAVSRNARRSLRQNELASACRVFDGESF